MDSDDHGIFFGGIEITRIDQPTLNFVAAIFPLNAFRFAPARLEALLEALVALGDLLPLTYGAGPDFREER